LPGLLGSCPLWHWRGKKKQKPTWRVLHFYSR